MSAASDYLETKLLDYMFNGIDPALPAVYWLTIFTDVATVADLELGDQTNEVTTTRQTVVFSLAVQNQVQNTQVITFPSAPLGGWGNIKYLALMDAQVNGNLLIYGLLSEEKIVVQDDSFKLPAGSITVTLT